jgi:hypothetical protein
LTSLTSYVPSSLHILGQDLVLWAQDSDLIHPEGKCLCITKFVCCSRYVWKINQIPYRDLSFRFVSFASVFCDDRVGSRSVVLLSLESLKARCTVDRALVGQGFKEYIFV